MILSFANLLVGSTVTASSEDTGYPGTNLRTPERPFWPYKSTALGAQSVVLNLGAAKALDVLGAINLNVDAITVQGNSSDSWGSPPFSQVIAVGQNPFMGRRQWGGRLAGPGAFNYQYMRLVLNSTPVAAPFTVYQLGGLWAGAAVTAPTGFPFDWDHERLEPKTREGPSHGGWEQESVRGDVRVILRAKRFARFTWASPWASDEARTWALSVDQAAFQAGPFLLIEDLGESSLAWVVRAVGGSAWTVEQAGVVSSPWELHEVIQG